MRIFIKNEKRNVRNNSVFFGGAENAEVENAGVEKAGVNRMERQPEIILREPKVTS